MRVFKYLVIVSWILLTAVLISRDLFIPELAGNRPTVPESAKDVGYYGIWFQDQRIGYVSEQLQTTEADNFLLTQKAFMNLKALQTTQAIHMDLSADLDSGLNLKNFQFSFKSPFYSMTAQGTVTGKKIDFTLDTGRTVIRDTLELPRIPVLEINSRSHLLEELKHPGDKARITSFDPLSLTGKDITVEYLGPEKMVLQDKVMELHGFAKSFSGIRIKFWLDRHGKVIKEQSPAGFTFLSEPKHAAMNVTRSGDDLLSSVSVPFKGPLPPPETRSVTYRLSLPTDVELDLTGGRQQLREDLLTISAEPLPLSSSNPTPSDCGNRESLQPSPYVQSDHPEIRQLAREIIGKEQDRARQVRLLTAWLFENLEKRPVIGLPDALTTLKSRIGDCNEHAALFAALARSLGIPTNIAAGVTLFRGAFYYHAWNEVCLDSSRISLDSTTNQFPADLTHLRFVTGDMAQQIKIGALLGKLEIEILPPEKMSTEP